MDVETKSVFHPLAVWGQALNLWTRNLVPLVALSSLGLLLARMLKASRPLFSLEPVSSANVALSVFFVIELLAALVANALLSLLIIHYVKGCAAGRVIFAELFDAAKKDLFYYIRVVLLLMIFLFAAINLAAFSLGLGETIFRGPGGDFGLKLGILVASGTFFVVTAISIFWYGFFFSLYPLVAAFERTGALEAIKQSRRRVRGNAWRYLATLVLFFLGYLGLGILVYKVLSGLPVGRFAINAIDPLMLMVFSPLWLTLWYLSYEKLTEIKATQQR